MRQRLTPSLTGHERAASRLRRSALAIWIRFQHGLGHRILPYRRSIVCRLPFVTLPPSRALTSSSRYRWALGSGHAVVIDHYGPSFPVTVRLFSLFSLGSPALGLTSLPNHQAVTHSVLLSPPSGRTAWKKDSSCIWKEHGLWGWDAKKGELGEPVSLRNEYFKRDPETGKEVEWYK